MLNSSSSLLERDVASFHVHDSTVLVQDGCCDGTDNNIVVVAWNDAIGVNAAVVVGDAVVRHGLGLVVRVFVGKERTTADAFGVPVKDAGMVRRQNFRSADPGSGESTRSTTVQRRVHDCVANFAVDASERCHPVGAVRGRTRILVVLAWFAHFRLGHVSDLGWVIDGQVDL